MPPVPQHDCSFSYTTQTQHSIVYTCYMPVGNEENRMARAHICISARCRSRARARCTLNATVYKSTFAPSRTTQTNA